MTRLRAPSSQAAATPDTGAAGGCDGPGNAARPLSRTAGHVAGWGTREGLCLGVSLNYIQPGGRSQKNSSSSLFRVSFLCRPRALRGRAVPGRTSRTWPFVERFGLLRFIWFRSSKQSLGWGHYSVGRVQCSWSAWWAERQAYMYLLALERNC